MIALGNNLTKPRVGFSVGLKSPQSAFIVLRLCSSRRLEFPRCRSEQQECVAKPWVEQTKVRSRRTPHKVYRTSAKAALTLTVLSQVGVLLLITDRSRVSPIQPYCPQLLSGSIPPAAQSSVDFVCREGFRNIVAEPLPDLLVTGVIGVPKCIEKLCKSLRSPTVFR